MKRRAVLGLVALLGMLVVHSVSAELMHTSPMAMSAAAPTTAIATSAGGPNQDPSCPGSDGEHDPASPDQARAVSTSSSSVHHDPLPPLVVASVEHDLPATATSQSSPLASSSRASTVWVDLCVMRT